MSKSRRRIAIGIALILAISAFLVWRQRNRDEPSKTAAERAEETEIRRTIRTKRAEPVPRIPTRARRTGPLRLTPAQVDEDLNAKHGAFSGRVINWGSGKGVAGAEIVFAGDMGAATARSDADGNFEFVAPQPGHYRVAVVSAKGYLPFAPDWGYSPIELVARPGRRVTNVVLYLTPAIAYTGIVVDADKQRVEGATIKMLSGDVGSLALAPINKTYTSDAKGEFTFNAPDFAVLEARHARAGMGRARVTGDVQISRRMVITLDPKLGAYQANGEIRGRVVDDKGAPIADAVVQAWPTGGQKAPNSSAHQKRTEADGSFTLTGLDAGAFRLLARHPDYASSAVSANTGDEVTIAMKSGGVIRGHAVRRSDSEPVVSFAVVVMRRQGLTSRTVQQTMFVSADGAFELTGLEPGKYVLRAIAHGYAPSPQVSATASIKAGADVTLKLPQGGTLTGKVIDADSKKPLENAKVSVENSFGGGPGAAAVSATVVTDANGDFTLAGVPLGRSSVTVAAFAHHRKIVGGFTMTEGAKVGPITIELAATKPGETPKLELAGLGIVLRAGNDGLVVQRLIDGGGGKEAGLVVGDVIIAVEGERVAAVGMSRAIQRIRGPVNTTVAIVVRHADGSEQRVVAYRRKIRV